MSATNKAGYTAIQSWTVGQELKCKTARKFENILDGQTYRWTDGPQGVELRVACPRLKTAKLNALIKKMEISRLGFEMGEFR